LLKRPGGAPLEKVEVYVTYKAGVAQTGTLDLAELRRSLGLTQRQAALLLEVALNTWARWERGELGLHPERARQLRRLRQLVEQYGEPPLCGLGVDGLREGWMERACLRRSRRAAWTSMVHRRLPPWWRGSGHD
jgi:transcriptional regulator with XRE-family HTH domain